MFTCEKCNSELEQNAKFCTNCGEKVPNDILSEMEKEQPSSKVKDILAGVIVGITIIVAFLSIILLSEVLKIHISISILLPLLIGSYLGDFFWKSITKKKSIILILVLIQIIFILFLTVYTMYVVYDTNNKKDLENKKSIEKILNKDYFEFKDIYLNVTTKSGKSTLMKLSFKVSPINYEVYKFFNKNNDLIIDKVIFLISKRSKVELLTKGGRELFREELKDEINSILLKFNKEFKINKIIFTDYIIKDN